jgi:hypothetical protein
MLLEAIRLTHTNEWESSWRYNAFLGQCYYFSFEPEKAFEAYKSAMKKVPKKPHPGLLIALGGCTGLPGGISIGEEMALNYLKMAIQDYLYIDAALLLRSMYQLKHDSVNEEFWTEMLAKALKTGMFAPSLELAVYETDEDDALRGWQYRPDIDMKRAKELEEELRDVLNSPYALSRRALSGIAQADPPIVSKSIVRSLLMREDRRICAGIGQKAPPPKCVR